MEALITGTRWLVVHIHRKPHNHANITEPTSQLRDKEPSFHHRVSRLRIAKNKLADLLQLRVD